MTRRAGQGHGTRRLELSTDLTVIIIRQEGREDDDQSPNANSTDTRDSSLGSCRGLGRAQPLLEPGTLWTSHERRRFTLVRFAKLHEKP